MRTMPRGRQPWSMPRIDRCVKTALDALYPPLCPLCSRPGRPGLCLDCVRQLERPKQQCPRCGAAAAGGPCGRCQRRPPAYASTIAPFAYAPPLRELIHHFKYRRRLELARPLAQTLAAEIERSPGRRPELIVPVPLHWRRLLFRGFNQSAELARHLATVLDIPCARDAAARTRHTASQAELALPDRARNVRRCFALRQPVTASSVALVDDVMTSGETLNALATLLAAHVDHIQVWALARA